MNFGGEEAAENHRTTQTDGDAHGGGLHPVVAGSDIEDGLKREPDDAGGVHGEPDELGLVEIFRALSRLECVDGAEDDEDAVVGE